MTYTKRLPYLFAIFVALLFIYGHGARAQVVVPNIYGEANGDGTYTVKVLVAQSEPGARDTQRIGLIDLALGEIVECVETLPGELIEFRSVQVTLDDSGRPGMVRARAYAHRQVGEVAADCSEDPDTVWVNSLNVFFARPPEPEVVEPRAPVVVDEGTPTRVVP